jgi:hypothetical protein
MIMKKHILLLGLLFLIPSMLKATDPTLEEILLKYYKATGLEKLLTIKTVEMTGSLIQQDIMPLKVIKMRPDKFKMEFDVQDITAYQVYDGKTAWMTAPWTGNPKPQPMSADRAKDLRSRADFDGILFNWQAKGHHAELVGRETLDSLSAYKIKLTRDDGGIEYYFIDASDFLLKKRISYRKGRDKDVVIENFYSDYRNVEDVMFNFVTETAMDGQIVSKSQFETIKLNLPVDETIFNMPAK